MSSISIKFVDFWNGFDKSSNFITEALKAKFNVEILEDDDASKCPDILFYSVFGDRHLRYYDCIKVFYTGENDVPDFNEFFS